MGTMASAAPINAISGNFVRPKMDIGRRGSDLANVDSNVNSGTMISDQGEFIRTPPPEINLKVKGHPQMQTFDSGLESNDVGGGDANLGH